jgi:hypothetical protein
MIPRRGAESNRCAGLCRPLPNHSATPPCRTTLRPQERAERGSGRLHPSRSGWQRACGGQDDVRRDRETYFPSLARERGGKIGPKHEVTGLPAGRRPR